MRAPDADTWFDEFATSLLCFQFHNVIREKSYEFSRRAAFVASFCGARCTILQHKKMHEIAKQSTKREAVPLPVLNKSSTCSQDYRYMFSL